MFSLVVHMDVESSDHFIKNLLHNLLMQVIPPVNLQYSLPSYPNDHQSKHLTVSINNAQKHFKIHGIFEKP